MRWTLAPLLFLCLAADKPPTPRRGALILVAQKPAATVMIIDPATKTTLATLPTGTGPHEIADGKTAYVSLLVSGTVAVVDLDTKKIVEEIPAGDGPDGIALAVL